MPNEKYIEYSVKLKSAIADVLNNEENDFHISKHELQEGDNLTDFFHALANAVPTSIYNNIIGDDKSWLHFNHLANQLCFQYSNKSEEVQDGE